MAAAVEVSVCEVCLSLFAPHLSICLFLVTGCKVLECTEISISEASRTFKLFADRLKNCQFQFS